MSTAVNPITSTSPSAASPAAAPRNATDALANESTFLKLLVSQLQNQDPLNPTDSSQFVSQLTSYSQLEQLIKIDQNTTTLAAANSSGNASQPAKGN
jgi:flagellar basal-body rod modification protein FlgD